MATSKHQENIKFMKAKQHMEAAIKIATGIVTFDKPHNNMSEEKYRKQAEKQIHASLNTMFEFLNKHEFTKKELIDTDYIADKIYNFVENFDIEISDEQAVTLAMHYQNKVITNTTQTNINNKQNKQTDMKKNQTAGNSNTQTPAKTTAKTSTAKATGNKAKGAVSGKTQPDLTIKSYQDLAKMYGNGFVGKNKQTLIDELTARAAIANN